ncbi:riboflavin biosynthesis protein RibD [Candidatus Roizmanbacteria bacterium CG_4_9_14_0_2_um_filter_39_13]|uniref:Riboflavin biosynthesis protein RibD n=1 Tax=Candidatus Roizmanbacteria bacterium CG_4_9_14_0_2_um_filter_39_13 TaxID=1974839 RepID=A0A2M8F0A7_9BACT|nr:MAG: riboflavin biosynthesis protein RibD [Candidatus Roizmanbacteria bacterium CG_4_10_14_0_2_um_filter_39_12]PJC32743.1 MAG: riboflavin biosynthesis protein RibD [Candidatus Roizmanbacteria bacterium CG_4_9_14_0_2_um_filter_39_13]
MNDTETDMFFMKKVLQLAKKGRSFTYPNPMVGALLVKNNIIIGQGYHRKYGHAHAEIETLKSARQDLSGATIYVNLEPCSHIGKTPPCSVALIKAGIKKVICSHLDPNPLVSGKGLRLLQKHGIQIKTGILKEAAQKLNEHFITFHTKKRPFIAVKFASSLDGKIATSTGSSKWITNEKARSYARRLRSAYHAILVGKNTILYDNPHLGCRNHRFKDPIRIVLDSKLSVPFDYQIYRDNNVIIATTTKAPHTKIDQLYKKGIQVLLFDADLIPIEKLVHELKILNIMSVLIEGGSEVIGEFIDKKLVDKAYIFQAPILIGGKKSISAIGGMGVDEVIDAIRLDTISYKTFDDNRLICGYVHY